VPAVKLFTPIKVGSKGQAVKDIQALLKVNSDGDFGLGTEKAVKAFQTKEKLPVTGIIDEETFRHLKGVK
jgi:peptidoglycan hydrolase-like protein with peptidoglycan-binding domain